ncbi:fatty acid desaturase [Aliishimia ponticola]|uniref:Fatty acid desaturase n=1 Tax=Aliishimia ponticola TaxID=2499833 RepID=A0A4S4NKN7_9RHOB|nr:fatty acid desaturase [Aliishimia ponticola]THH38841.1 fatty acid desaturase [Aliishimia ponticola]
MTDHTAVLARLSQTEKAALQQRSDRAGLRHLAGYLAALALTTTLIVAQVPFWGVVMLPHGILLVFLFTLSHEATHQTPFATRWINEVVGHAIAPVLALPFLWFRYFHLAHHKWTNDPDRDPEIAGHPRPRDWRSYLIYLSGWSYWSAAFRGLFTTAFGTIDAAYLPARVHPRLRREARIVLAVQFCWLISLLWSPLALWLWIVPVLIGQPFLRLYLLAEHGLCPPVANMLENTRTTFTNRMVRWLAWNMPYHIEHHSAPNVPFHSLPDLHRHMRSHLVSTSDGYAEFTTDYARSLSRPPRIPQG